MSPCILLRMKNFSKLQRRYIFCLQFSLFRKSCHLWDNVEKYGIRWQAKGDNIIQGMRFACWTTKVTDAHLECVILIVFPRQHRLRERTSLFRYSYIAGLVNLDSRWWWLVNFSSGPFTLGKIAPNDDRAGGWVTEAIWRTEERRTYSYWKSNHEFLVVHLVLQSLLSRFKLTLTPEYIL